jgi:hypothetical protein
VAKKAPDLYSAWLGSLRAIASPPAGTVPSFMQGEAFADLRLNSAIAGFGQLRHNYVLLAAQSYSEGGCEIPDGYVDPAVGVYEGVAAYAERGAVAMRAIDPGDRLKAQAYFKRLGEVMQVLRILSLHELANQPLPRGGREFLSMVAEMTPETTGSAPTYTGWYFDLFRRRQEEALVNADLIADFFTAGDGSGVSYVGTSWPALGVFVVDTGGAPRLAVGPVARAYEAHGPLDKRLTDQTADTAQKESPWAKSYAAPAPLPPELALDGHVCEQDEVDKGTVPRGVFTVRAKRSIGPVRVELLDHHYAPVASLTRPVGAGSTRFVLRPRGGDFSKVQGVALHAGSFSWRWQRKAMSCGTELDFLPPPAKE